MRRFLLFGAALALCVACARAQLDAGLSAEPRLEATIEGLGDSLLRERMAFDSLAAEGDSLRSDVLRLEAALRAREDTIRALRLELQRLKEIDLKPRARPVRAREPRGTGVQGR